MLHFLIFEEKCQKTENFLQTQKKNYYENNIFLENFMEYEKIIFAVWWVIFWIIVWYFVWRIIKYKELKDERSASIKKSKSVILWEVYEKVLPFLPNFPFQPRDMVFLWKWVDYVILDWISEWNLKEIIFLEVKSGTSQLNKNEKMIREAIKQKKVRYEEYRI